MPKIIINDEFIEKYQQKYDEKENDRELLFSWNEIPGNDNEKLLKFLNQNFGIDWVKTATIKKIRILDELYGTGIPVASTIIHFIYPKFFPIVDFRTVEVLWNAEKLDKSKNYHNYRDKNEGYVLFCEAIQNPAKEHPKYSLRQIDKALFAYHKYELKSKTSCGLEEACD